MRIINVKNYQQLSRKAANIISAQVILKPDCVLGLATGSSPVGTYKQLIEWYNKGDIDFSEVTTVNLDEYVGLCESDEQSYRRFMQENLFDHISIRPENTYVPDGLATDVDAMCSAYERTIEDLGGVDLQLLGLGHDGHIGFNEPGDHFPTRTHETALAEITRQANARFFASEAEVPTAAYTMGVGTVMAARRILMIVTGADKSDILHKAFFGPVTPWVPASILQFHPNVTLICDRAAWDGVGR